MAQSFSSMLPHLRNRLAGPGKGGRLTSKRHRGAALHVAALAAVAVLAGCAGQAGPMSGEASDSQGAPYHVAGPLVPAPKASRAGGAQACYGTSAGLVDECGPFPRYNGIF